MRNLFSKAIVSFVMFSLLYMPFLPLLMFVGQVGEVRAQTVNLGCTQEAPANRQAAETCIRTVFDAYFARVNAVPETGFDDAARRYKSDSVAAMTVVRDRIISNLNNEITRLTQVNPTYPANVIVAGALAGAVSADNQTILPALSALRDAYARSTQSQNTALSVAINNATSLTIPLNNYTEISRLTANFQGQGTTGAQIVSASAQSAQALAPQNNNCTISWNSWGFESLMCVVDKIVAQIIKVTLINIGVVVLGMTSSVLDWVVKFAVADFACIIGQSSGTGDARVCNASGAGGIYPAWYVVKQMVTLFIIFAGFYLGFLYMSGSQRGDTFKRYLPFLLIYALLVNFSYPIARTAIDWTSSVSISIYENALGAKVGEVGAGIRLLQRLGVHKPVIDLRTPNNQTQNTASNDAFAGATESTGTALLVLLVILATVFIFAYLVYIFIVLIVVQIFGIIFSPILFVDKALPILGEYAEKFRAMFLKALATPLVFALGFYLVLFILDALNSSYQTAGLRATGAQMMFFYILLLAILYAWVKTIPKAGEAIGITGSRVMTAALAPVGLAGGLIGAVGRQTAGRLASRYLNTETMNGTGAGARFSKWVNNSGGKGFAGMIQKGLTGLSKGTYNPTNLGAVQSALKGSKITAPLANLTSKSREENAEAFEKEVLERARTIQDPIRAEEFIKEQFSSVSGKLHTGEGANLNRTLKNYQDSQKSVINRYMNANLEERMKMRKDPNNSQVISMFNKIDAYEDLLATTDKSDEKAVKLLESMGKYGEEIDKHFTSSDKTLALYAGADKTKRNEMQNDMKDASGNIRKAFATKISLIEKATDMLTSEAELNKILTSPPPNGFAGNPELIAKIKQTRNEQIKLMEEYILPTTTEERREEIRNSPYKDYINKSLGDLDVYRQEYSKGRAGAIAGLAGKIRNQDTLNKVLNKSIEKEVAIASRYARSSASERERMKQEKENSPYQQLFTEIDSIDKDKTDQNSPNSATNKLLHDELKQAVTSGLKSGRYQEFKNVSGILQSYLNAGQTERVRMYSLDEYRPYLSMFKQIDGIDMILKEDGAISGKDKIVGILNSLRHDDNAYGTEIAKGLSKKILELTSVVDRGVAERQSKDIANEVLKESRSETRPPQEYAEPETQKVSVELPIHDFNNTTEPYIPPMPTPTNPSTIDTPVQARRYGEIKTSIPTSVSDAADVVKKMTEARNKRREERAKNRNNQV